MQNARKLSATCRFGLAQNADGVVFGLARVDDQRQARQEAGADMLTKVSRLRVARRVRS
jgi:hypothetical protein